MHDWGVGKAGSLAVALLIFIGSAGAGEDQAVAPAAAQAERVVRLVQEVGPEAVSRYVIELQAEGELVPSKLPDAPVPEPIPLKVESRFDFYERALAAGEGSGGGRVVRYARQAAVAINSPGRPLTVVLRPEVTTLVARVVDGQAMTYSVGGPLSRQELDILQGQADPLLWGEMLAAKEVAEGDTWAIGPAVARSLTDYESLASNTLRAKLESLDSSAARIHVAGEVRGAVRGGEGTMSIDGWVTYDRRSRQITEVQLDRSEKREPGHVEAGFTFKGKLTARRTSVGMPPELSDAVIKELPTTDAPALALLRFSPPGSSYALYHDRDWHLFWEDDRLAVLKRLDHGEILAQCNLSRGPNAGKGRHQDPAQFREDVRKALGTRFKAFVGAGEVTEDTASGFRYKVAVQGRESDRDVLWYYYLLASPEGDQVLATFTLNLADQERFGDRDLEMIGSLTWKPSE
jgi:hypothetical protein